MKKLFVSLAMVVTILVGGFLGYSIWNSAPRRSQRFLESGKAYYQEKKYPEAAIQFLNVLQRDPQNRDARYLLAVSYLSQMNLPGALKELRTLLEYYPADVPGTLQLGDLYLLAGRSDARFYKLSEEFAEKVLAKEPANVAALILAGNAAVALQDPGKAAERYERAASIDPKSITALVRLGAARALQRNFPEAERTLLRARQVDPKDKVALMTLANFYRAVDNTEKAEEVFEIALAAYPADKDIYLPVAAFFDRIERFERSEQVLTEARKRNPKDPEAALVLSDFYLSKNRPEDARKLLVELKQQFPESMDVAGKLARNLLRDQPERARAEIDQILKTNPKSVVGQLLLGESQFLAGQFDAAEATLSKDAIVKSPYAEPHFFLGKIAEGKGRTDQAQEHYEKALALQSAYLPARVSLAQGLLDRGKIAEARQEVRKALDVQSNFAPARLLKASLDIIDKKYPEAERELSALLKEDPENAIVLERMGFYEEVRGRFAAAEKNFNRAVELRPQSPELFQSLIRFYVATNQTARAMQRIESIPDSSKQAFHYDLMAAIYSRDGKLADSEKAYKKALEKEPGRVSSQASLASQYLRAGREDDALRVLDEHSKGTPGSASVNGMKGFIYERQGNFEEAKKYYSEALRINPNAGSVANNLAYVLAEQGRDLTTALSLAQTARKLEPENPSHADTLGWVQYKRKDYVLARKEFLFAVGKQPNNPVFLYHLAKVYLETNQITEADSALRKALSARTEFKDKGRAEEALKEISKLKRS